ncbi:hypothetical protein ES708_32085 [subsurface metagenome]
MSGVRWCFVNWKENEQEEPGDTLVHTFIKPDWPVCQTRWFYFLGTKQAEESPSASPIFHLHREAVPITTYPSLWHNRYVYSRHGTWSTARNGYGESKDGVYQRPDNKLSVHTGLIATYFIIRAYLNFHTQGVGVVKSARLGLYVTDIPAYNFDLCITKGLWDEPVIPEDFGLQTDETTILGQKSTADMVIGQYNWIDLNQAGIDWINQRPVEINQFESYDWNANMSIWVCAVQQVLMSFTPIVTHTLTNVKLRMYRVGTPGTLHVSIYAANPAGEPVGPPLASGTINADTFTTDAKGAWYLIILDAGGIITAGNYYCIVCETEAPNATRAVVWIGSTAPDYPYGHYAYSGDGGATWTHRNTRALYFIEYETLQLGGTKFCLRTASDQSDSPPGAGATYAINFHSAQKGEGYLPLLEVTT